MNVRSLRRLSGFTVSLICLAASGIQPVAAQSRAPMDSALARARRLVNEGNGVAGRAVVDSILAATPEGSAAYAEPLYWRASLADAMDRARRDYLRLTVEYATSPRAADALLRLAQMEFGRGDRGAARRLLERLAFEYGDGPTAAPGAYWKGRVLLEDGALLAACASFAFAKTKTDERDVELAGQIAFYAQPCARAKADVAARAVADSVARADSLAKVHEKAIADSLAKARRGASSKSAGTHAKGPAWSAQVAAFSARGDAERLAKRLSAKGHDVRITETKPYRVRIGRFSTRAAAAALVEKLRTEKMQAIVVEAERP